MAAGLRRCRTARRPAAPVGDQLARISSGRPAACRPRVRAVTAPWRVCSSWGLHVAGSPVARRHAAGSEANCGGATGGAGAPSRAGRGRARAGAAGHELPLLPRRWMRLAPSSGRSSARSCGPERDRAGRPPAAAQISMTPEGRGVVARQGQAVALPQSPRSAGASGAAVPRAWSGTRRSSTCTRATPGLSGWSAKVSTCSSSTGAGRRRRRATTRSRRTSAATSSTPSTQYVASRQPSEISMGAYCMGALMAAACCSAAARRPGAQPRPVHAAVRLPIIPRRSCSAYRDGRMRPRRRHRRDDGPGPGGRHPRHVPPAPTDVRLVQYVTLWENLWRDDYVESHRAVNHWAWNHRAMAGPAFTADDPEYVRGNALVTGSARARRPRRRARGRHARRR